MFIECLRALTLRYRLFTVGYPTSVLGYVSEAFLRKAKGRARQKVSKQPEAKPVVLPYMH